MKKNVFKTATLGLMLMISVPAGAQIDLGNVLNDVLGSSNGQQVGDLVSNLTSVFSSNKQATAEKIVGTWAYSEPAIVFKSNNLLAKATSKLAANKIEKKLQEYLSKYGIEPGTFSMTFNEDGTFTETIKGKTAKGKWEVKNEKLVLTVSGVKALSITTQIDGKDLQFVTDATKLLNLFKAFGTNSSNSNLKMVSSLMKSVDGMQAGITLRKQ
jgi:hypothetical protein